ncbi:Citrate transporter [Planctomycetales bacterium 10988]|nr:Citrate transporter [Planctomycetales bacterium 10988]
MILPPFSTIQPNQVMMSEHSPKPSKQNQAPLLIAIFLILAGYGIAAYYGLPQYGTELQLESMHHHDDDSHHEDPEHLTQEEEELEASKVELPEGIRHYPPLYTVLPFAALLLAIAILPLLPATEHWWESNLHRFWVAAGLAIVSLIYYFFFCSSPVEAHWLVHREILPSESGFHWEITQTVLENAILYEYIPFIMLLFSLYTISGGIRIEGDVPASPKTNTGFIALGGLLASFVGTTGAAMLLIRPLLETNKERHHVRHTVVFFIFVVCNCGGLLLPIGDPPLFLGYLRGVDFWWTLELFVPWVIVNSLLLGIYYLWDARFAYPAEKRIDLEADEVEITGIRCTGLINFVWLLGVVASVAFLDPSKTIPGTDWHPWAYMREIVQLGLVGLSLLTTPKGLRVANNFGYGAIIEVAALFVGIFICMQPALQILDVLGPDLGLHSESQFFWATGLLSAVLDNAPTYVVFFETARTLGGEHLVAGVDESLLAAISLGAVFMGAMTYIGNGPNFMVKAIAEKEGVEMPSFFGYMVYSCAVLLPILIFLNIVFSIFDAWILL